LDRPNAGGILCHNQLHAKGSQPARHEAHLVGIDRIDRISREKWRMEMATDTGDARPSAWNRHFSSFVFYEEIHIFMETMDCQIPFRKVAEGFF
jgi:hypothetical protein